MDTLEEKKHLIKILTWKKYQELKDKPLELAQDISDLEEQIKQKDNEINKLNQEKQEIGNYDLEIARLENKISAKDDEIRKLKSEKFEEKINHQNKMREVAGRNGGLVAQNNRLNNKILDLEAQIEELKSGKYKLLELPPDIAPKQVMSMKKAKARAGAKEELKKLNKLREGK